MRRQPGPLTLSAVCAMALAGVPATADSTIEPRYEDGQTVFTFKPARKPGGGAGSPAMPGHRAAPPEILQLVEEVSSRYGLDPRLITTVIGVESGFNQRAVSSKGARGLMQLMPGTARRYGVRDVYDPKQNVEGGVAYLSDLTRRYGGDLKLALAAYNAGPEAVARASGVPNFRETKDYIRKIESRYGSLTVSGMGAAGGTRDFRSGGSIQSSRDESGALVVTNRRGTGARVIPRRKR